MILFALEMEMDLHHCSRKNKANVDHWVYNSPICIKKESMEIYIYTHRHVLCIYYHSHTCPFMYREHFRIMKNLTTICCPYAKGLGV